MDRNEVFDASLMLTFLKKEEDFYNKILKFMEQENIKLQIEEFALKAAIRQEQIASKKLNVKHNSKSPSTSSKKSNKKVDVQSSKLDYCESSESTQNYQFPPSTPMNYQNITSELDSVCSSITDDRYLEPLILNPSAYDDSGLVEFDD